jgi:ATP-binding cassette subfamily G (WHITE) protein 2 (PDR)
MVLINAGLDSQTAWSIVSLLRKLSNQGQAILCTLHQPSAILFQEFDRLLFLAHGGKTLYFGDIGPSSKTFVSYFERNGARPCGSNENPAEWLLEITGAAGSQSALDWSTIWRSSTEYGAVKTQLATLKKMVSQGDMVSSNSNALQPFATSHSTQMKAVLVRVFQQYWRTPSYLYSKVSLGLFSVSISSF